MLAASLLTLVLAGATAPPSRGLVLDRFDDTFGGFLDQPDLARVHATHDDAAIVVRVDFHAPVSPPDFDLGLGLVGSIELDLDHDPATGTVAFLDVCPAPRSTGFERMVTLWGYEPDSPDDPLTGTAPVLDTNFDTVALATVRYEAAAITVTIPRDGGAGDAGVALIVGTPSEPTDCAPETGVVRASALLFGDGFE